MNECLTTPQHENVSLGYRIKCPRKVKVRLFIVHSVPVMHIWPCHWFCFKPGVVCIPASVPAFLDLFTLRFVGVFRGPI